MSYIGLIRRGSRFSGVFIIFFSLLLPFVGVEKVEAADGGYPWSSAVCVATGKVSGKCPNYEWSYGGRTTNLATNNYYYRNCTDYVAWRLTTLGVAKQTVGGLGNAGSWDNNAPMHGLGVSSVPTANSVGVDERYGHVVFVESVNGSDLTISEYNWGSMGTYGTRSGTASSLGLSEFIDFGISSGSNQPQTTVQLSSYSPGLAKGAQFLGTDTLKTNQYINPGQYIESANTKYILIMQGDGNLVEYGDGQRVIWNSRTGGNPGAFAVFQWDGNLVVYSANWRPLWASGVRYNANNFVLQTDGNLVTYQGYAPRWASGYSAPDGLNYKGTDYLTPGQFLNKNEYLRSSDKRYSLILKADGDLVAYGPGYHEVWSSGTAGRAGAYFYVQTDGNLVIYDSAYHPIWATTSKANPGRFYMQSDGNVVQYRSDWHPLWASNTGGRI